MALQIHQLPTTDSVPSGAYMILKREVLGSQLDYKVDINQLFSPYVNRSTEVGTNIGQLVKLIDVGGNAGFPAIDGSQLTNINSERATNVSYGVSLLSDSTTSTSNASVGETAATPLAVRNMGLTKLNITGGDLSGDLTFNNNTGVRARKADNSPIKLLNLDTLNDLTVGHPDVDDVILQGSNDLIIRDTSGIQRFAVDLTNGNTTVGGTLSLSAGQSLLLGGTPIKYTGGTMKIGDFLSATGSTEVHTSSKFLIKDTTNDTVLDFEATTGNLVIYNGITPRFDYDSGNGTLTLLGAIKTDNITPNLVATNHVDAGGGYQSIDESVNLTRIDVDSSMAPSSWTSVGPTGSGADYIWTALDDLPYEAKSITISCFAEGQLDGTSSYHNISVGAAIEGITPNNFNSGLLSVTGSYGSVGQRVSAYNTKTIPLDSNNRIQIRYSVAIFTNPQITLYYNGFHF